MTEGFPAATSGGGTPARASLFLEALLLIASLPSVVGKKKLPTSSRKVGISSGELHNSLPDLPISSEKIPAFLTDLCRFLLPIPKLKSHLPSANSPRHSRKEKAPSKLRPKGNELYSVALACKQEGELPMRLARFKKREEAESFAGERAQTLGLTRVEPPGARAKHQMKHV